MAKHLGCPFCDPLFVPLVTVHGLARQSGTNVPQRGGSFGRGKRGRGHGRGQGGRGARRGRGRRMRGKGRSGYNSDDDYVDNDNKDYIAKPKEKMSLGDFF